ncbi:uncharacterized protein LOC121406081 [Lytechinus variegatus]|uniref:uncharacterized protein LOC121406081 n=1 Tax=Lytechinus variegatus TaxID=7654 RepID=UPI001BB1F86B|nr:uncharacterized protein LOC121406081 [Lytechinus variegatus]
MQYSGKLSKQGSTRLTQFRMKRSSPMEPKGQNFSVHEKLLLLDLISKHGRQLVEENDTLSIFRRSRIWRIVFAEFNHHHSVTQRTEKQLRLLWKNLKARCKREFRLNASKYNSPGYVITDPLLRKMSTLIGTDGDAPAPGIGRRLTHESGTVWPQPRSVNFDRTNMAAPTRDPVHLTGSTSDSSQGHTSTTPRVTAEQSRSGEVSRELAVSRRKKAIPRKASESVKAEVIEIEDDVVKIEESEGISERFYEGIPENGSNNQESDSGWLEDPPGPSSDASKTYLQEEPSSVGPGPEPTLETVPRETIPQNNLHHHMPIRTRKPLMIQSQLHGPSEPDDYFETMGGGRGEDSLLNDHRQSHHADLEVTDSRECSPLEKEMLVMARKEHEMKMSTMLLKRKQIMQIKRREHLAKMENYKMTKEILRLKKRKYELEIRNGLYLEGVEDELDS